MRCCCDGDDETWARRGRRFCSGWVNFASRVGRQLDFLSRRMGAIKANGGALAVEPWLEKYRILVFR
jgi:hypothetical protein